MASTNATIATRCQQALPLWNKLSRSSAPYHQKVRALQAKAWPAFLHGISSVHLSDDHYDKLRTGAVRALGEHSAGVAPAAHLSLIEPVGTDPQFQSIWMTVTMARQMMLTPDHLHWCLQELHIARPRVAPRPGPVSVLLHRLHQVAWSWVHGSIFADQWGFPIDIMASSIQELRQRLAYAWQSRVSHTLSARKTFQGMQWMSPTLTMEEWHKHQPEEQALLRTCLNGTFFAADRPVSEAQEANPTCVHCGRPDSQVHRHWECPNFAASRLLPSDQIQTILGLPPCVTAHGWMPEPPSLPAFRQLCMQIPDLHTHHMWPPQCPPVVDIFTDGSCRVPTCPVSKISGWGVALGLPDGTFWPLAQGLVPGWIQTALRGEIWAAISACQFVLWSGSEARLWIDNITVCKRLQRYLCGPPEPLASNKRNADLWNHLRNLAIAVGPGRIQVVHVHSHQNLATFQDVDEEWICQGNQHADSLADGALNNHPQLLRAWDQLQIDLAHVRQLRKVVHSTLLKVGKQAVLSSHSSQKRDKQYESRLPDTLVETQFQRADADDLPTKYQCDRTQPILDWAETLVDAHVAPRFVSWFQLNALYEYQTGDRGVRHTMPSRQWAPGSQDTKHVNFVKRTNAIASFLKSISGYLDMPCQAYHVRPASHVVQFWTQCIWIRFPDALLTLADEVLQQSQPVFRNVQALRCI